MTSHLFALQTCLIFEVVAAAGASASVSTSAPVPVTFMDVQVGASMASVLSRYPGARRHEVKQDLEMLEGCDRTAGFLVRFVGAPHANGNLVSVSARRVSRGYCRKNALANLDVSPVLRGGSTNSITLNSLPADVVGAYGQPGRTTTNGELKVFFYDFSHSKKCVATSLSFTFQGEKIESVSLSAADPTSPVRDTTAPR